MDPQVYKLHRENEKEHWWYKGRREIISVFIKKFILSLYQTLEMFMSTKRIKTHKII